MSFLYVLEIYEQLEFLALSWATQFTQAKFSLKLSVTPNLDDENWDRSPKPI